MVGYLDCEFVWYEVQVYEVNTNDEMCSTGTPVDVYCGNTGLILFLLSFLSSFTNIN